MFLNALGSSLGLICGRAKVLFLCWCICGGLLVSDCGVLDCFWFVGFMVAWIVGFLWV